MPSSAPFRAPEVLGGTSPSGYDLVAARRAIADEFGPAVIARWHAQAPLLDWLVVGGLPLLFAVLAWALTTRPVGAVWLAAFVLQGFLFQAFAHAVHDLFVHRRVGGRWTSHVVGAFFHLPIFYRRTWYALYHLDHHKHMGSDLDTEAYKQDLDRRWKRWLCLTFVGFWLARQRRLRPADAVTPHITKGPLVPPSDSEVVRRLRAERWAVRLFAAAVVAGLALAWEPVVYGYLLPLIVVGPIASMVRLVLEHGEADPRNVYHCATFYRTGPISRPLFFWDAGDCHVVHHLFPGIPFYRMGGAVTALRPFLVRHGARQRRSLPALLFGYFVENRPHRALWPA